jgi:prepilin-type N-terminal cleavage/methylation domain-containing protein
MRTGAVNGKHQAGFTLIEVLVAASLSVFITLAALSVLVQAATVADVITSKVRINQEARLLMGQLLDGATFDRNGDGTIQAGDGVPGYHGGALTLGAANSSHACPMVSIRPLSPGIVATNLRVSTPDVYATVSGDTADRVGLSSSVPGATRQVACFDEDKADETVGPWDAVGTPDPVNTVGRDDGLNDGLCATSASTPNVNGFVSVFDNTTVLPRDRSPAAADTVMGNDIDDIAHLRLDIVDISLLAGAGGQRSITRGQHTESYMLQVRCQRELQLP